MPRTPYDWSKGPAQIEPHSLAKHTILRRYVEQYVTILTQGGQRPLRVSLIDGFAGGGQYVVKGQDGKLHDGSPLILIEAVQTAAARINVGRQKVTEVDADFIFVEKEQNAYRHLCATLEKRLDSAFLSRRVHKINGAFEKHLDWIIARLKPSRGRKPRPIFVLDQYGYSRIPVDMIARIMKEFETAEVFLTLAVDHIPAYASSLEDARSMLRSALHVPASVEEFVLGKRDFDEMEGLAESDRSEIMHYVQCMLHEAFARHAGARFYTPFFITSKGSHRSYWFLHLANNHRANDVVKALHWQVANHFQHHGRPGTKMLTLGFDASKPGEQLAFDFGDSARDRTVNALIEELPQLLQQKYPRGVSLNDLYGDICTETPASKGILGVALNELCSIGELEKRGAAGEEREPATKLKDHDVVLPSHQTRLFSIPQSRGARRWR
jgi:three-Cys-motif partner protein